jgi:hypothetical protein
VDSSVLVASGGKGGIGLEIVIVLAVAAFIIVAGVSAYFKVKDKTTTIALQQSKKLVEQLNNVRSPPTFRRINSCPPNHTPASSAHHLLSLASPALSLAHLAFARKQDLQMVTAYNDSEKAMIESHIMTFRKQHADAHAAKDGEYDEQQAADELSKLLIKGEELKSEDVIGKGSFGVVFKGNYRGQTVAVKTLREVSERSEWWGGQQGRGGGGLDMDPPLPPQKSKKGARAKRAKRAQEMGVVWARAHERSERKR